MKIAILTCLNSNSVCTGAACFKAFNERSRGFECYVSQDDLCLSAFMKCNGCEPADHQTFDGRIYVDDQNEKGVREKIKRLKEEGIERVHVGICTKTKGGTLCPTIVKIINLIEQEGIRIVHGTH